MVACLLMLPAEGAAQSELRATFEVRPRAVQPELVAAPTSSPTDPGRLTAQVPSGWLASSDGDRVMDRRGTARAGAASGAADRRTVTWTFVPL